MLPLEEVSQVVINLSRFSRKATARNMSFDILRAQKLAKKLMDGGDFAAGYMLRGIIAAIEGDENQAIKNHERSLEIRSDLYSIRNFISSLVILDRLDYAHSLLESNEYFEAVIDTIRNTQDISVLCATIHIARMNEDNTIADRVLSITSIADVVTRIGTMSVNYHTRKVLGDHSFSRLALFADYPDGWGDYSDGKSIDPRSLSSMEFFLLSVDSFVSEPSLFFSENGFLTLVIENTQGEQAELEFGAGEIEYYIEGSDEESVASPTNPMLFEKLMDQDYCT